MALQSMTGFARSDGVLGSSAWHWEAKSVNNRGLDVRLRLPPGYDALEIKAREAVGRRFARGSINVSLTVVRQVSNPKVQLNESALAQVVAAADRLRHLTGADAPRADGLLALKGVLEVIEEQEDENTAASRQDEMLKSLEAALDDLGAARVAEGARLEAVVRSSIDEIARLTQWVASSPARTPAAIEARLKELVGKLVETGQGLDPQRLHQEAIMLATRADVEEEVKRLAAHVDAARELLSTGGPVGRKLDFLAQELNREANTLTSKATDTEISRAGLSLKLIIDQVREQVQNIE